MSTILLRVLKVIIFAIVNKNYQMQCASYNAISTNHLLTPDLINKLVSERSSLRSARDYESADRIKALLEKEGVIITDYPYKSKLVSSWTWTERSLKSDSNDEDILSMARNLSLQITSRNSEKQNSIIEVVKGRLLTSNISLPLIRGDGHDIFEETISINTDCKMQGRKYADAAFEFAFSGISDNILFQLLSDRAEDELKRFGSRPSCRPLSILQIIERLAVAGVRNHSIYNTAFALLEDKEKSLLDDRIGILANGTTYSSLASGSFSLFSDRPLLWLWRFASKQKKAGLQAMQSAVPDSSTLIRGTPVNFSSLFADPSLPLVVDIGCGYGVILLRMCEYSMMSAKNGGDARRLNYLGVDMNQRCILYANGLSRRWGLDSHCTFLEMDCLSCLDLVIKHYLGPVMLALINFPTPYNLASTFSADEIALADDVDEEDRADGEDDDTPVTGNGQLPESMDDFMCNEILVDKVKELFKTKAGTSDMPQLLFIQSNVEDVAVTMRNIILREGMDVCFAVPSSAQEAFRLAEEVLSQGRERKNGISEKEEEDISWVSEEQDPYSLSLRDKKWLEWRRIDDTDGNLEGIRALGKGWLTRNPFIDSRTETEVHCAYFGKRVHRMLFLFNSKS